ncbi:MAG: hypothetical protein Q4P28_05190 [Tissierellia bacterium]|nr:hypothetical protein [Tissierellia bacterium]
MERIDPKAPVIIIAQGLLMYFKEERGLIEQIADYFENNHDGV